MIAMSLAPLFARFPDLHSPLFPSSLVHQVLQFHGARAGLVQAASSLPDLHFTIFSWYIILPLLMRRLRWIRNATAWRRGEISTVGKALGGRRQFGPRDAQFHRGILNAIPRTTPQQNYYFIRGTLLVSSVVAIVVSPSWLVSGRVYGSPASTPGVHPLPTHVNFHVRSSSRACGTYISTFHAHTRARHRRTHVRASAFTHGHMYASLLRDICLAVHGGWVELWWTGGWPCGRTDDSLFSGLLTGGVFGSYMLYGTLKIAPG